LLSSLFIQFIITAKVIVSEVRIKLNSPYYKKDPPWPLVRKRNVPTERPPLVGEIVVPTFSDRGMSPGQPGGSPTVVNPNL
jgi:hypothetical protein